MEDVKGTALMILANGIYTEAVTEDQAINILLAMDKSSHGNEKELDLRAKALTPILTSLTIRYVKEGHHEKSA